MESNSNKLLCFLLLSFLFWSISYWFLISSIFSCINASLLLKLGVLISFLMVVSNLSKLNLDVDILLVKDSKDLFLLINLFLFFTILNFDLTIWLFFCSDPYPLPLSLSLDIYLLVIFVFNLYLVLAFYIFLPKLLSLSVFDADTLVILKLRLILLLL